jgi:predicted nucleic acid binding AN1-type Zn finger protein
LEKTKEKKIEKLEKKSNFEKKKEITMDYCCNPQCFVGEETVIPHII